MYEISYLPDDYNKWLIVRRINMKARTAPFDVYTTAAHVAYKNGARVGTKIVVRCLKSNSVTTLRLSDFGYFDGCSE